MRVEVAVFGLHPTLKSRCLRLPPAKKNFTKTRQPACGRQQGSYSRRANAILTERDRHLATIDGLRRRNGAPNAFAAKALTLLTRGWGLANWTTRADLLRTAAWLLQLQRLQDRN
jgi:hypothetical protein